MINEFLARLDNDPSAPVDWVWPVFTAKVPSEQERLWREAILPSQYPREQRFLRALVMDEIVQASPQVAERTALDPRITYTATDVAARTGAYGYTVIYRGITTSTLLSLTLSAQAPDFLQSLVTATSGSAVSILTAGQNLTTSGVTFSGGLSGYFSLTPDGSIQGRFAGTAISAGQTWQASYWSADQQIAVSAVRAMQRLGDPLWLPVDLHEDWRVSRRDLDKLACVLAGFARP